MTNQHDSIKFCDNPIRKSFNVFFENEIRYGKNEESQRIALQNELDYRISRRGRVLIFNYVDFIDSPRRSGSEIDVKALEKTFAKLQFKNISIHKNLTKKETDNIIQKERKRDHSSEDCLIIFILSHGESDSFYCRDSVLRYDYLFENFSGERCPSLISKPKLFFFQCCRGERFDKGNIVYDDTSNKQYIRLPVTADIFAFYATFHEYYAWRNPKTGSWFVQEFVKIVQEYSSKYDLLTLATLTCRAVAFQKESNVFDDPEKDKKKQMPTFMSTLTKRLFFYKTDSQE